MTQPMIGVVTVLYNSDDVLPGFFQSLEAQQGVQLKLYVIDNSPSRSGLQLAEVLAARHRIDAELVFNAANLGVAKGNNQGIVRALRDGCTHILIANNDVEFGPSTITTLLTAALETGAAVTPKILFYEPSNLIWYAGGSIDRWRGLVPHAGMMQVDRGQFDQECFTEYAPTCFLLMEASCVQRAGPMDERYFVYYDDTDFVWRLNASGLRIRYLPSAVVRHKVSASTGGAESAFSLYWSNRNRIFFIRKNLRGLQRASALAYTLLTRVPRALRLPWRLSRRMFDGVRDGFRIRVDGRAGDCLQPADADSQ